MVSLIEQVAVFLAEANIGTFSRYNPSTIFLNRIPPSDKSIAIFARNGVESNSLLNYSIANVQVIVTDKNQTDCIDTANAIDALLHGFEEGYFLDGENYIIKSYNKNGMPYFIGRDEKGRYQYTSNYTIELRR